MVVLVWCGVLLRVDGFGRIGVEVMDIGLVCAVVTRRLRLHLGRHIRLGIVEVGDAGVKEVVEVEVIDSVGQAVV
jgi:hypothetical protein